MLLVAPWLTVWERNLFVETLPFWGSVARLDGVRGAVSGVGLVSLGMGVWELTVTFRAAILRRRSGPERLSPPAEERALAEEAGSWLRKP